MEDARVITLVIDRSYSGIPEVTVGFVGDRGLISQEFSAFNCEEALGKLGSVLDSEEAVRAASE
jgi:hypothetical protein